MNWRTGKLNIWGLVFARAWRVIRLLVLVAAFFGALTLHRWSMEGDPRFYHFLDTPVGQRIGTLFGWWSSPLEVPIADKPIARHTRSERVARAELTTAGPEAERAPITYRDVRFRLEFAGMQPHLQAPYLVMTDAAITEAALVIEELESLHDEFRFVFGELARRPPGEALIHVLYFSDQDDYLAYKARAMLDYEETSGFYSPAANRLVLFRPAGFDTADRVRYGLPPDLAATIRHEGAHQLFFDYGIHSRHRMENDWLVEGLATYCEEVRIGAISPTRTALIRNARRLNRTIPLAHLVNLKSPEGLLAHRAAELAYSQSWSLVHLLMTEPHRESFFAYIREVRDPEAYRRLRREEPLQVLCRHLDLPPRQLAEEWQAHLERLFETIP